jgi:hypothetical protein
MGKPARGVMHALHINDWIRKSYDGKLFTRRFLYHGKMRVMDTSNRDWRISCALAVQNCVMAPRQYSRSLNAPLMLARASAAQMYAYSARASRSMSKKSRHPVRAPPDVPYIFEFL